MSLYQHGKRTRQTRNTKVFLGVFAIVGAALVTAALIVSKDIGNSTAPKTNVPIVTEVGENEEDKLQINEKLFSFKLPSDWKLLEKRNDQNHFYVWTATKKGASDRKLTIYVDTMPGEPKIVRLQPITPENKKLFLGNISGDCVGFAGNTSVNRQPKDTTPFNAKWENVSFLCDPIVNNQTVGTGTVSGGIATPLTGSQGKHTYFFFYQDHNIRPDDKILIDALKSFQVN
ncbi:MAG: hypothetical protein M3Q14_04335 [bacterium]|nr:hypothetical protein [bacterium]